VTFAGSMALFLLVSVALAGCSTSTAPTGQPTAPPVVIRVSSARPTLIVGLLPVKTQVPLTVQAVIRGFSQCSLVVTAIDRRGTGRVISRTSDADGPRPRGAGTTDVGNYFVLAKVPRGSGRVVASAACSYGRQRARRKVRLSARVVVPRNA